MKYSKYFLINLILVFAFSHSYAQEKTGNQSLRVMFYNVENLFDTYNDSLKRDDDFTPEGNNHWNWWRYNNKLQKVSKIIIAVGEWNPVDIIGFAEIENRYVLEELLTKTALINSEYEIIHQESPDSRGIDVGMIYLKDKLKLLSWEAIEVSFNEEGNRPTRDILYAKFLAFGSDTLHTFVNHWPSRYGGQVASEPKRMRAAQILSEKLKLIEKTDPNAAVVIVGDLNDEPENRSVHETLNASKSPDEGDLINLTANMGWNIGTHKYQGKWGVLDHIIISKGLWFGYKTLKVKGQTAHIFSPDWLMEPDVSYQGMRPKRTYLGPRYVGGYSDHLPVYVDIELLNQKQTD